jgi:membrane protease YdiL (CAAX protease family)
MDEEREEARRDADGRISVLGGRNLRVTTTTAVVGAAVVAWLTAYNLQACPAWALGAGCTTGRTWEEYLVVNLTGLVLAPIVAIFALPREGPHLFGLWRPRRAAWRIAGALYLGMLIPMAVASRLPAFAAYYPMRPEAAYSGAVLLYHELTYGLYMLGWEFFYRGFLTFGLARRFGNLAAVLVQAAAFGLMHYGKPWPEFVGSFAAGMTLGWLAVRARSFYPGFCLHWACSTTFDLMVIYARPDGIF